MSCCAIKNWPRRKLWPLANFRLPPVDRDDSVVNFADVRATKVSLGWRSRLGGGGGGQLLVTSLASTLPLLLLMASCFWVGDIVCLASSSDFKQPNLNGGGGANSPTTNGSSELSLESRGFEAVPVAELCSMMAAVEGQVDQINVVSLANNRIRQIDGGDFQCSSNSSSSSGSGSGSEGIPPSMLRILILRNNEIERLAGAAFTGLGSLQVLLLDNNRLTAIPSTETLKPLKSLRHLNLANNRIESLDNETFVSENSNLISLNLNGNPLHQMAPNSLVHLTRLKTLSLSQSALSGQLTVLEGLPELRYYHLDRGENLITIPVNLCQSSRKISSLVLKSNKLEQVPQFQQCQSLLLLDLSYNRIHGSLSENFTNQQNLIDLYLGHNQIDHIGENAFSGLARLQVLELDHNNLIQIHPNAFLAIRMSLYELNLANNNQLTTLTHLGLDRLASFKAYGNGQLRRLPQLRSASSLVLTYAYHCCDYLGPSAGLSAPEDDRQIPDDGPLITQLLSSALNNIRRLLWPGGTAAPAAAVVVVAAAAGGNNDDSGERDAQISKPPPPSDNDTSIIGEIILWPKIGPTLNNVAAIATSGEGAGSHQQNHRSGQRQSLLAHLGDRSDLIWQTEATTPTTTTIAVTSHKNVTHEAYLSRPEVLPVVGGSSGRRRLRRRTARAAQYLIDELLEEAKQIRLDHSVGLATNQIWRRPAAGWRRHRQRAMPDRKTLVSSLQHEDGNAVASSDSGGQHHQNDIIEFWSKYVVDEDIMMVEEEEDEEDDGGHQDHNHHGRRSKNNFHSLVGVDKVARVLGKMLIPNNSQQQQADSIRHHRDINSNNNQQPSSLATSGVQCLPKPGPFFPCQDLFDTWWLRLGVWCVFLLAFTGNILVIVVLGSVRQSSSSSALTNIMWLAHSKRHIDVPRFLVINLAIADLIMALYLGILAFVDLSTLGEFKMFAIKWQYSTGCKLASFLGVLSSELSIFILAIITLERNYAITNAVHLNRRLSLHKAMFIMFIGYSFAFLMALMPLNGVSDYRKFSICLPLDMDSNFSSQIYVMALICINAFSFILLLSCYLRMYCAIRGSQAWNTNDLRIAKRMSILVLTDFLCWMPIIVAGLGSLFGHHLIGSNGIKILTIFILPLNSVANPFLYAITTKKFKRDLDTLLHRLRRILSWLLCCCCSTSTNSLKDPNAFPGYYNNNYHRNMMIMMDHKTKRPQYMAKCGGNGPATTAGGGGNGRRQGLHWGQDRRHQLTRAVAAQTAEQCTINRTTPYNSCRRLEIQQTTSDGGLVVHCQRAQMSPLKHLKPPSRVVDQSKALQANDKRRQAIDVEHTYNDPEIIVGNYNLATGTGNGGSNQVLRVPKTCLLTTSKDLGPSSEVIICTTGCAEEKDDDDDEPAGGESFLNYSRFLVSSVTSPGQLDGGTTTLNNLTAEVEPQRHLLSVAIQQTNRSASACGFSPNVDAAATETGSDHPGARLAAGSCDIVRAAAGPDGNSLDKLSRSINRLLFHPIAKAWSSIQISLNSNGGGACANATTIAATNTNVLSEENINLDGANGGGSSSGGSSSCMGENNKSLMDDSDQLLQDSTTMDDLLMASGCSQPSSRQFGFRSSERRMSRSCDHIKSRSSLTSIIMMSPTSSGGHEATTTTTSQGDYDDDERILLATIDRMTANKVSGGRRKLPPPVVRLTAHHDKSPTLATSGRHTNRQKQQQHHHQYARNRCTRCRSWSPALLNKLEDCIYQIKCRIPGLSVKGGGCHMGEQDGEDTLANDHCDTTDQVNLAPDGSRGKLNCERSPAPQPEGACRMSQQQQGGDSDDDDQFDTNGENPLNSNNKMNDSTGGSNHQRLNKLHQQSSGNSDSLSTQTGGTIVTNMSESFDSNTNISNQVGEQTQRY